MFKRPEKGGVKGPTLGSGTGSASATASASAWKSTSSAQTSRPVMSPKVGGLEEGIDEYARLAVESAAIRVDALFKERMAFLDQAERRIKKSLEQSTKLMESINVGLDRSTQLTEQSLRTQSALNDEVSSIKGNAVAALSIFVSFFAFITVSISVFSKAESVVSASVLLLIFWCLLIGFNLLISIQFKVVSYNRLSVGALFFVILSSVLSILAMFYFSPELRGIKYVFKFTV